MLLCLLANLGVAGGDGVVTPQVVTTVTVGGGDIPTWQDHVKALNDQKFLELRLNDQKKELKRVQKKIKVAEQRYKSEKSEGILENLWKLEQKKEEIEHKIQAMEVDLKPLILAIEKFEIEEDDQEFMSLQ